MWKSIVRHSSYSVATTLATWSFKPVSQPCTQRNRINFVWLLCVSGGSIGLTFLFCTDAYSDVQRRLCHCLWWWVPWMALCTMGINTKTFQIMWMMKASDMKMEKKDRTYRDKFPDVFKGTVCDAAILDSVSHKPHSLSKCTSKHSTMTCRTRRKSKVHGEWTSLFSYIVWMSGGQHKLVLPWRVMLKF